MPTKNEAEGLDILTNLLIEHEKQLEVHLVGVDRERPIVHNLRNAIAALKGEPTKAPSSFFRIPSGEPVNVGVSGLAIQPLPGRRPEFADMTIMAALQKVLAGTRGKFIHADEIVKLMYQPTEDNDVFYRIKRTIVSELLRGMKKGLFVRGPGKNMFGLGLMTNGKEKDVRPTL